VSGVDDWDASERHKELERVRAADDGGKGTTQPNEHTVGKGRMDERQRYFGRRADKHMGAGARLISI
jgi:hypothetical protein